MFNQAQADGKELIHCRVQYTEEEIDIHRFTENRIETIIYNTFSQIDQIEERELLNQSKKAAQDIIELMLNELRSRYVNL